MHRRELHGNGPCRFQRPFSIFAISAHTTINAHSLNCEYRRVGEERNSFARRTSPVNNRKAQMLSIWSLACDGVAVECSVVSTKQGATQYCASVHPERTPRVIPDWNFLFTQYKKKQKTISDRKAKIECSRRSQRSLSFWFTIFV